MSDVPYTIEVVTGEDEVINLSDDWNRLSLASDYPNVFMTFDWFQAWYQRLIKLKGSPKRQPNIIVLRKNGIATGISPIVQTISSRFGFSLRRLEFLAREHEWDYNDLILGNDVHEQIEAIINFLNDTCKDWDLIDLRNLRDTGTMISGIKSALARTGLPYRQLAEEERCPYLRIDSPWSEMLNRHSRSTRRTYQRFIDMTRKGLNVRIVDNPHEEPQLLSRLIAVEAQKQVGGRPSPPFLGKYPDVFQHVFDTLGPRGWISVVLSEWKDELVAWQLLYRCGESIWGYLTAYDHRFSDLSPGAMLIPKVVDYGFTHGFNEFDFLKGEESYKMRWSTGYHQTYRLLIWNRRWVSRLSAMAYLKFRVHPGATV
ncbi:MAG TPA: GNAT family N-acetyltransferase [Terracidiphilus sp.]